MNKESRSVALTTKTLCQNSESNRMCRDLSVRPRNGDRGLEYTYWCKDHGVWLEATLEDSSLRCQRCLDKIPGIIYMTGMKG